MRCCLHCRCGRSGVSRRRVVLRLAMKARRASKPLRSRVVLPLQQVVQQPMFPVKVLGASGFWDNCLEDVAAARKSVFFGSLAFDNSKLLSKLLGALARGVKVEVLVDRASLEQEVAPRQRERLLKLKEKGAKIYVAGGRSYKRVFGTEGRPGNYHAKTMVVDGVTAYVGSPNHTNNSLVNGEVAVRLSGGAVAADVYNQAWAEARRPDSF